MVYKVDGNPQLDTCDSSIYSNILNNQRFGTSVQVKIQGTAIKLFLRPCNLVVTHVLWRDDEFCWSIFLRKTEIRTNILLFNIGQDSKRLDEHQLYFREMTVHSL